MIHQAQSEDWPLISFIAKKAEDESGSCLVSNKHVALRAFWSNVLPSRQGALYGVTNMP